MSLFSRIFRNTGSKEDAKARLKMLLVHDAVDLTPREMEAMKAEVMEVIARYVDIDKDSVDFRLARDSGEIALVSNVPVRRVTARAV
mgnify:CR=1 FL=1